MIDPMERVRRAAMALPGVTEHEKYDGTPLWKVDGAFFAGAAGHGSAEAGSVVVRMDTDGREAMLAEAPEVYYVTPHYGRHGVVLARLGMLTDEALRDLLRVAWRLTARRLY